MGKPPKTQTLYTDIMEQLKTNQIIAP
jgi:hypothetical protein